MTRIANTPNQAGNFNLFQKLCQTEFGLNFYDKNESVLQTAIETRMQESGLNCSQKYFQLLEKNKHEQQEFICLLTINETYFYREQAHLDFLTDVLIPKIQSSKSDKEPIRILSVGCSTGAEPYSIAMALDQKFPNADKLFSIIGSDVDYQVLKFAKQARYNALTFRALPDELKQRYFIEEEKKAHHGQEFRLIKKIRDLVSWQYFNIVADPIDSNTPKVDVIFFRNVSIYFDKQTLFKIHQKFVNLLKENAYLIVGLTETLSNNIGPLSLRNEESIYYFQNTTPHSVSLIKNKVTSSNSARTINDIHVSKPLMSPSTQNKPSFIPNKQITQLEKPSSLKPLVKQAEIVASQPDKQQSSHTTSFEMIKALVVEKKYQQALDKIENCLNDNASLELKKERAKFLLLRSYISFNAQDFHKAKQDAVDVLSLEPFSIDVFLLLGMIGKWTQQVDDAISWFKKALYIHPHCWPAHYYLAGLYFETGNSDKAVQEYRLAIQQLEHPEENFSQLLTIPLTLPKTEIRLLAQTYLQQAELAEKGKRYGS